MRKVRTFRQRLTVIMTSLAAGVLVIAGAAIYLGVRQALLSNLDTTLLSIARAEVASAVDEPGGQVHLHEETPSALALPIGSGYEKFAQIKDGELRVRAQTANLSQGPGLQTDAEREHRALQGQIVFADIRRDRAGYRSVYYPLRDSAGRPLLAVVAIPRRPTDRSLQSLLLVLAVALLTGSGAAAVAARRLAGRLTRPLEQIADAAHGIGGANLTGRIPDVSSDVELREVADVLNAMLARLEAAFQAQRRFIADASHELRSPLSNLRGTVEVALRQPRSVEEYRNTLTVALEETERLSRLVNDLVMLSRVDANQFSLQLAPCDLAEIVQRAVTAHAARAEQKGVALHTEQVQSLEVLGDAHRLRQALDNLLDNALRHAPAGSAVAVTTEPAPGEVAVSIRDAGPGLSAEDAAHVFDRFYRADASRARDSGGLGLGLPIAKAIVEAHHGRITLHSAPGHGCVVSVHLPRISGPT